MTDRPKSIVEALAEVQRKVNEQRADRLANMMEAMPVPARRGEGVTGVALANQGISRENRRDQAYVDSVFGAGKMKAGSAESNLALLKKSKEKPAAPQGSQSQAGDAKDASQTAAPVVDPKDPVQVKKADDMMASDRKAEKTAAQGTSSQLSGAPKTDDNSTLAQQGKVMTPRTAGIVAAAGTAGQADRDQVAKNNAETGRTDGVHKSVVGGAFDPANIAKEREANLAARAAPAAATAPSRDTETRTRDSDMRSDAVTDIGSKLGGRNSRASQAPATPSSDSPSMFSKVKDFFTKPTETKVGDNGIEPESGPKGKKKMSESALISAFLKLQETNHPNIFEAAKKAKKDYDGDGKIESGKDEYLGSRIAAAKKAGKMEEELKGDQKKIDANNNGKIDGDDFRKLRSGKKSEKMKAYRADRDKHGEMEEETDPGFSEAEIAHFEAVIARKDQKGKERGIGDTVDSADLTDEYINEMARKPGETRGRKKGTKIDRGYKKKATDLQGNRVASADVAPDEATKGIPHVLDQIRHGREDEHGFKTITHPASSPEAPVSKAIHRSELHGFYDQYHNTEKPADKEKAYRELLHKHFGDSRTSAPTSQSVTTDLSKIEKSNLKGGSKVSLGGSKLVGGKK